MRVLFAGTPAVAIPTLKAVLDAGHQVVGVLTAPAAPAGRGRKLTASDVAQAAAELQLRVLDFADVNSPEALTAITKLNADVAVVVAYGQLLKPEILNSVQGGWINLHFSLLPQWRGAAPVQHAILAGDEITGASTFKIESGLDTGPVFGQLTTEISADETAGELLNRLAEAGAPLMVQTLRLIEDGIAAPTPQPSDQISYATKISVTDAKLNWWNPALAIKRQVRAFNPSPYAWSMFANSKIVIGAVEITSEVIAPGEIQVEKNAVLVGTGSTAVQLLEVKPAGKGWMKAADWARGVRAVDWKFDV